MSKFIRLRYIYRDYGKTQPPLPWLFREDVLYPKYEVYFNTDTIELISDIIKEEVTLKKPYSTSMEYEKFEMFIIKTISNNWYYCAPDQYNKLIQEDNGL